MFEYPHDTAAAAATAEATWLLVWATGLTFVSTTAAVITALCLPGRERRVARADAEEMIRSQVEDVHADIRSGIALMQEIRDRIATRQPFQTVDLWRFLNRLNIHRTVLQHHFDRNIPNRALPIQLATVLQGFFETRDAVHGLLPGNAHAVAGALGLQRAIDTADQAVQRVENVRDAVRPVIPRPLWGVR